MYRLTDKHGNNYAIRLGKQAPGRAPEFTIGMDANDVNYLYGAAADRLAAYENLGHTPEEIQRMIDRLEFGPDGSDKIDELESALDFVKFERDNLKAANERLCQPVDDESTARYRDLRGLWQGRRIDDGIWIEGNLIRCSKETSYITVDLLEHKVYKVEGASLGECVGSRDKNNKPIFEGNRIRFNVLGGVKEHTGVVFWDAGAFYIRECTSSGDESVCKFGYAIPESIEVIGNSYNDNTSTKNSNAIKTDHFGS